MARALLHVGAFLIGATLAATALRQLDAVPFWSWSSDKAQHLLTHGLDHDTVFLGSSRMHYGLQPEVFDRTMAEHGEPTRSFNAALSGLRTHDTIRFGEWLLENRPATLRRLVVELHDFHQAIRGEQWLSDQELEMHPPSLLACRLQSLWVSRQPVGERLAQLGYLLVHTLGNALNVGQGPRIVDDLVRLGGGRPVRRARPVADLGWKAVEAGRLPHMLAEHEAFVRSPEVFEERLIGRIADPVPAALRGGFRADAILDFAARAERQGVAVVFVVMPVVRSDLHGRDQLPELAGKVRVLTFDEPLRHRSLYEPEHFHDPSHLSTTGAEWFSRRLADHLSSRPPATPDLLSRHSVVLTARWSETTPRALQLRAAHLPFLGEAIVMIATARGSAVVGPSLELGIALPAVVQRRLQRTGPSTAAADLSREAIPTGGECFAQLGVLHEGAVIALSAVVPFVGPD